MPIVQLLNLIKPNLRPLLQASLKLMILLQILGAPEVPEYPETHRHVCREVELSICDLITCPLVVVRPIGVGGVVYRRLSMGNNAC
jgi:hypothetical protein